MKKPSLTDVIISQTLGRLIFYFFWVPMVFLVLNTFTMYVLGFKIIDASTLVDVVFILGGMILSILWVVFSIIIFNSPSIIFGHVGDLLAGVLLLGAEYSYLVVTAWNYIIFLPFEIIKFLFGFDLLYINLEYTGFKVFGVSFDIVVTLDIRNLVQDLVTAVVEALKPRIAPIEYFQAKLNGEIVGFRVDPSSLFGLFTSGTLLNSLRVSTKNEKEE